MFGHAHRHCQVEQGESGIDPGLPDAVAYQCQVVARCCRILCMSHICLSACVCATNPPSRRAMDPSRGPRRGSRGCLMYRRVMTGIRDACMHTLMHLCVMGRRKDRTVWSRSMGVWRHSTTAVKGIERDDAIRHALRRHNWHAGDRGRSKASCDQGRGAWGSAHEGTAAAERGSIGASLSAGRAQCARGDRSRTPTARGAAAAIARNRAAIRRASAHRYP